MKLRFGLDGYREHTQKEVADSLGISQSYISRLEKRIIQQLKKIYGRYLRLDCEYKQKTLHIKSEIFKLQNVCQPIDLTHIL